MLTLILTEYQRKHEKLPPKRHDHRQMTPFHKEAVMTYKLL